MHKSALHYHFVESASQITLVQCCSQVGQVQDLDRNVGVWFIIEQEGHFEPDCWISQVGVDVTVELDLCPIDDRRSNEWWTVVDRRCCRYTVNNIIVAYLKQFALLCFFEQAFYISLANTREGERTEGKEKMGGTEEEGMDGMILPQTCMTIWRIFTLNFNYN